MALKWVDPRIVRGMYPDAYVRIKLVLNHVSSSFCVTGYRGEPGVRFRGGAFVTPLAKIEWCLDDVERWVAWDAERRLG